MRTALLIGVDHNWSGTLPQLRGCANDVSLVGAFLARLPVTVRRPLINDDATTEAINAALAKEIAALRDGYELIVHYSGHGVPFPSGNSVHDAICPVDYDETPEHVITGEQLGDLFDGIVPGARVTMIADSCYSGGLQAHIVESFGMTAPGFARHRTGPLSPPLAAEVTKLRALGRTTSFAAAVAKPNVLLLTASRGDELADEAPFGGTWNGVLTYLLVRQLQTGGLSANAQDTLKSLRQAVREAHFEQTPELHGGIDPRSTPVIHPVQ